MPENFSDILDESNLNPYYWWIETVIGINCESDKSIENLLADLNIKHKDHKDSKKPKAIESALIYMNSLPEMGQEIFKKKSF